MMKILKTLGYAAVGAIVLLMASPVADVKGVDLSLVTEAKAAPVHTLNCGQLWYERNAIYARNGYCFKSKRARNVFGPRCYPPYGRLSRYEQNLVNSIVYWERRKGCR